MRANAEIETEFAARRAVPQNRREVIWTPEAQQDRDDIRNYIATDNPKIALEFLRFLASATANA